MNEPQVTVEGRSEGSVVFSWTDSEARYHVWGYRKNGVWHADSTLYKNPPLGTPHGSEADYPARKLDLRAKAHAGVAKVIDELAADLFKLDQIAANAVLAAEAKEREAYRLRRIEKLKEFVAFIQAASADDLAEAVKDANPKTAAAAELLRRAKA